MRTGLDASTVTPGRTAPDVSRTTPAMDACANATAGVDSAIKNTSVAFVTPRIVNLLRPCAAPRPLPARTRARAASGVVCGGTRAVLQKFDGNEQNPAI